MTREEKAAYNYARERLGNIDYPVYNDEYELVNAFKEGIDYGMNHPRWISVEEELPKEDGRYLVVNGVTKGQEIFVYSNGIWWYNAYRCPNGVVTHWTHLPQPPVLSNSEKTGKNEEGGEE